MPTPRRGSMSMELEGNENTSDEGGLQSAEYSSSIGRKAPLGEETRHNGQLRYSMHSDVAAWSEGAVHTSGFGSLPPRGDEHVSDTLPSSDDDMILMSGHSVEAFGSLRCEEDGASPASQNEPMSLQTETRSTDGYHAMPRRGSSPDQMAGGVLVGDENGDAAACDTGFPPTPTLESESEPESDVSDAQQELDVIDDMEDANKLSHGLARRFLETTWGSTCDCDEQSGVEPEEPAFNLDQMAQYWQTLGVPDAIGASLLRSMSAERVSTQLDWSSILSGGTNRPRLDIKRPHTMPPDTHRTWDADSVICYASCLSINRGLSISYHLPVSRNMETSVHIYHHSKALHTIPHFRLGSGRQSPQLGVFLFFPHITHAHRTTTYLTNGERQLWIDRLLLPAIRHLCPPDMIQHHPRSFADVESKTYSRRRETCSGLVRNNMDMLHYIPEQYLEGIWRHMGQNTDHPDLQQFRDMFVVLSAKNIKLEARSSTFEDCRSRITTHLRQILDWFKADLTRTWIDVGVEDTASHNSHTFLWRRRCLEAWTESLKHSDSHPLISSELFNFNLTEQAGSGRVELARAHPLRKQGILYAQRYNINKDIFSTASKRDHGLFGEPHLEGIACPPSLLMLGLSLLGRVRLPGLRLRQNLRHSSDKSENRSKL